MKNKILALDMGGTSVKAALYYHGNIEKQTFWEHNYKDCGLEKAKDDLINKINDFCNHKIDAVGLGIAGLIAKDDSLYSSTVLTSFQGFNIPLFLPLFGLPQIKDKNLTPEVVRGLSMIAQAVSDACEMEECPMDLNFSLDDMKGGDQSIMVISGKLDRVSRTPGFKKFLKGKPMNSPSSQPPSGDQVAIKKTEEASPNIDQLFMSRM